MRRTKIETAGTTIITDNNRMASIIMMFSLPARRKALAMPISKLSKNQRLSNFYGKIENDIVNPADRIGRHARQKRVIL